MDDKISQYYEALRKNYFEAYTGYIIYSKLEDLRNPLVVGSEAQKNTNYMNNFKGFFMTIIPSTGYYMFINLAKIFELRSTQSITIERLLNMIYANKECDGIGHQDDINKCRILFSKCATIIDNLKSYRDQFLAHEDEVKKYNPILRKEIDQLFESGDIIMNTIGHIVNQSYYGYIHAKKSIEQEIDTLIKKLK